LKNQKFERERERERNTLCLKGANLSLFNLFKNPKFHFYIPLLKGGWSLNFTQISNKINLKKEIKWHTNTISD